MEYDLNEYEDDIGLSEEDKRFGGKTRAEWFKGVKNHTYRVSFMYFHPIVIATLKAFKAKKPDATKEEMDKVATAVLAKRAEALGKTPDQLQEYEKLDTENVKFHRVQAHYKEGFGYAVSRLGLDGKDADEVWKTLGDPKSYACTALLIYPTNKEGEINKRALFEDWEMKPWRFGPKVYGQVHQVAMGLQSNKLSIASQDLTLKCTNEDFQNFDIQPCGRSLWRRLAEDAETGPNKEAGLKFQAQVLTAAIGIYDTVKSPFRLISTPDLASKLQIPFGSVAQPDTESMNFDDLLT